MNTENTSAPKRQEKWDLEAAHNRRHHKATASPKKRIPSYTGLSYPWGHWFAPQPRKIGHGHLRVRREWWSLDECPNNSYSTEHLTQDKLSRPNAWTHCLVTSQIRWLRPYSVPKQVSRAVSYRTLMQKQQTISTMLLHRKDNDMDTLQQVKKISCLLQVLVNLLDKNWYKLSSKLWLKTSSQRT